MPQKNQNGIHQAHLPLLLSIDAEGRLVYQDGSGKKHIGVEPIRSFPLSDPRHGIALCDGKGGELAWVESLDELVPETRELLEEALAGREFVPLIEQVLAISTATEPSEWEVKTNRGVTKFILNSEEDIHRLDDQRALLKDNQGLRYLITNLDRLDGVSRRLLERYI